MVRAAAATENGTRDPTASGERAEDLADLWMLVLRRAVRYARVEMRAPEGVEPLTGQQLGVLWGLRFGPLSMRKVAELQGVTPAAATALVARLVERGLVAREVLPNNRRVVWVRLTAEGERVRAEVYRRVHDRHARALAALTPEQRRQMQGILTVLERATA